MPIVYLVRHGRVAAADTDPLDPELDGEGCAQAQRVAQDLQARISAPLPILHSPLSRCRQTAIPLAQLWRTEPLLEPRVKEIPSPQLTGHARMRWLQRAFSATWTELERLENDRQAGYGRQLADWRGGVLEAILACRSDTVIFSHFMPINAIVGAALRQERVVSFRPAHASVTIVDTSDGTARLIELGRDAAGEVR
jgi:broad specificity phosphatase PhoE